MKSGQNGLIGPGSNDYGRAVKELTPELADKIWHDVQNRMRRKRESKEEVLHHLKQLKAQMGKLRKKQMKVGWQIDECMEIIDNKIEKIKQL